VKADTARKTPRGWAIWLFRLVVTITMVLAFLQAPLAGSFLSGRFGALALHKDNSTVIAIAAVVLAVSGVLLWRPGRGPGWAAVVGILFLAAIVLQTVLGYQRVLSVHVSLGVAIIALLVLLAVWAWRPIRSDAGRPPETVAVERR
jgi:hypothetical protein